MTQDCGDGQRVSSCASVYRWGLSWLRKSLVIRVLHSERRELVYWNHESSSIMDALDYRGLYLFAGPVGSERRLCMS